MAIRFSCHCGATFEVPDQQAGLRGRCLACGQELSIPQAAAPEEETSREAPPVAAIAEEPEPRVEEVPGRYCPFCGAFTGTDAVRCDNCSREMAIPQQVSDEPTPLTTVDWILATALAPLGMVHGFVLLTLGNKKGLDVIGLSVAAVLLWWVVFLLMGWI